MEFVQRSGRYVLTSVKASPCPNIHFFSVKDAVVTSKTIQQSQYTGIKSIALQLRSLEADAYTTQLATDFNQRHVLHDDERFRDTTWNTGIRQMDFGTSIPFDSHGRCQCLFYAEDGTKVWIYKEVRKNRGMQP